MGEYMGKNTKKQETKKQTKQDAKRIIGQKSHHEIKGENLILQSIKIFADSSMRCDSVSLKMRDVKRTLSKIKKGDVETFRATFYKYARQDALKIDGKSQKLGLCKHARARQHCFNVIAQTCGRSDLIVEYGSEPESPKEKKAQTVKA